MKNLAAALALATFSSGCAAAAVSASPPSGIFYTGVKGVGPSTHAQITDGVRPGPKQGQTCATGIMGMAAWGDMSLDTAKKTGGITRVDTVDYSSMRILGGVYVKNCTVITGE